MKEISHTRKAFKNNLQRHLGSDHRLSDNADLLIYLDFILFVKRLARASQEQVNKRQEPGKKRPAKLRIGGDDVKNVSEEVLRDFRG